MDVTWVVWGEPVLPLIWKTEQKLRGNRASRDMQVKNEMKPKVGKESEGGS